MEPRLYEIVHKLRNSLPEGYASRDHLDEMLQGKVPSPSSLLFILADAVMHGGSLSPADVKNLAMRLVHVDQTKALEKADFYGDCWFE